jgi:hypothetical protein
MSKLKIICSSLIKKELTEGILLVLTKIGCECYTWDRNKKPFFDMLDEKSPDILILGTNEEKALKYGQKEKKFKTVLMGTSKPEDNYDVWCSPYKTKLEQEKMYVFSNYANTIKYSGKYNERPEYEYDIVYFIDEPQVINKDLYKELKILFLDITSKNNIRFVAIGKKPSAFNLNEYIGDTNNYGQLMFSSKIGLDIFATYYLDFALFKKPCITLFNNDIFFSCLNLQSIFNQLNALYIDEDNLRTKIGEQAYDKIYELKLTDCHITSNILNKLEYNDLGDECLKLV